MNDLSIEEIDNIKDYMQGMNILRKRGLINNYIYDLSDIKEFLMLKYHPTPNDDTTADLSKSEMCKNYLELMKTLKEQLESVKQLINGFDFQAEFSEVYRLSESKIKQKIMLLTDMIERKKFSILTAGEAKAGKSTLVNLLLGCELMPMDFVTCTRMICEVRNSNEKKATFIVDENDSSKNEVIDLEVNAMEEISKIVKQEHSKKFLKGIFEYPVKFLDKFTYLVDSPGIGDTTALEAITFDFLNENAPAFIFVLNVTNSCGLNIKARQLIERAREELIKECGSYLLDQPDSKQSLRAYQMDKAIFILNHWDVIKASGESKETIENIRKGIINQIHLLWDESAEEDTQIFFISALQAREWLNLGLVQKDVIKLRKSLTNLVVKVYERNFQNCLGVLSEILDYTERIVLQKINTNIDSKYSRLFNKKHAEKLCYVLEGIAANSLERKEAIIIKLRPRVELMIRSLTDHLRTEEFQNQIYHSFRDVMKKNKKNTKTLTPDNKPDESNNVDVVAKILKKVLERQMYDELKKWEDNMHQIVSLNDFLNTLFEEQIIQISNEIKLENMFISKCSLQAAWNSVNKIQIKPINNQIATKMEQVFIISTIAFLFPVAAIAGVLASPLIVNYWRKSKKESTERQRLYESNRDDYIKSLIKTSMENISEEYVANNFFRDVLNKCMDQIADFENFIRLEIGEKRQIIKDIEKENRGIPEILCSLNMLLRRTVRCYGDYHMLQNKYLPDQSLTRRSSLYLDENEIMPVNTETISICQSSILFRSNKNTNVLLKMYSKKFTQQFARFQMQEVAILATGPFQCILQLKHICYLQEAEKLLLVMENADCNLEQYLKRNPHLVPTSHNRGTPNWKRAVNFIVDVSKKICTSLEVLHGNDVRMVHPDLRIDTIVVGETEASDIVNIYICDACSNLPTQRMHQKSGNVPSEVTELCFDMGGYTLENIYRLGIIFYEIAYFQNERRIRSPSTSSLIDDYLEVDTCVSSIESIESDVFINWNDDKHWKIPTDYNNLIQRCLSKHPQDRPNVTECLEILSNIKA